MIALEAESNGTLITLMARICADEKQKKESAEISVYQRHLCPIETPDCNTEIDKETTAIVTQLSRRAFLTLSGATVLAATLPAGLARAASTSTDALVGRALRAVPVYARPGDSEILGRLWPDSVTAIRASVEGWYAVPDGYVRREDAQPMLPYDPGAATPASALPAWVNVIAPLATVRKWVAGAAPLVARIGYGGVSCAVDVLRDDHGADWYALSATPGGDVLGWTPAIRWDAGPDITPDQSGELRTLKLNIDQAQLSAWENGREVLGVPVAVAQNAQRGEWMINGRAPTLANVNSAQLGAAWVIQTDGPCLHGVHWHNTFGGPGDGLGWEVPPLVARWLYGWLPDGAVVEVW